MRVNLFLFFILLCFYTNAQQAPMYSQYMFNMGIINPAYNGNHENTEITSVFRRQWVGINGSPKTSTISLGIPDNKRGLGFGLQLLHDEIGVETTNSLASSLSWKTHITSVDDEFSLGLLASIANFKANYNLVDLIQANDPQFFGQTINSWLPNVGAGVYYHTKKYFIGISAPAILNNNISGKKITLGLSAASNIVIAHYFLSSGILFDLNNSLKLKPSILIKAVPGAPLNIDYNLNLWINDIICVGTSYRPKSAVVGILEFQFSPFFRFGYSYDVDINNLLKYTNGTHEVLLRYEIIKPTQKIFHPRYF